MLDKDDGNDTPYFPATTTELNQRDTNFRATAKTPGKFYFTTSASPGRDETKSVAYYPTGQGPYRQHIYMTQNSE